MGQVIRTARITSEGQITVPKEVRDRLGVEPMRVMWSDVGDPREFACAVLLRESPDIDPETMRRSVWTVERMRLDEIVPTPGVLEAQAADAAHVAQSDAFVTAVQAGQAIPPLIVVGTAPVPQPDGGMRLLIRQYPEVGTVPMLADGYHRYRALTIMGVTEALVVRQRAQTRTGALAHVVTDTPGDSNACTGPRHRSVSSATSMNVPLL